MQPFHYLLALSAGTVATSWIATHYVIHLSCGFIDYSASEVIVVCRIGRNVGSPRFALVNYLSSEIEVDGCLASTPDFYRSS